MQEILFTNNFFFNFPFVAWTLIVNVMFSLRFNLVNDHHLLDFGIAFKLLFIVCL